MSGNFFEDIFGAFTPSNNDSGDAAACGYYKKLLDDYWAKMSIEKYHKTLNMVKEAGYKVSRNDAGDHIVRR